MCSIAHARRHLGWLVIILCHMIYRRRLARGQVTRSWFRLPFATPRSLLVIAFLAFLTVILGIDPDNRIALYTVPLWAGILIGGYLHAALQQTQTPAVAGVCGTNPIHVLHEAGPWPVVDDVDGNHAPTTGHPVSETL